MGVHEPFRIKPWVQEQEDRLFKDDVIQIIADMKYYSDIDKEMDSVIAYFENNSARMKYGTYKKMGLNIGSGAIESAGKQLSFARVKGAGMRWNVIDLNPLLAMRAAFIDSSWKHYWKNQELLAA